ncbi:Histidine kinase-, DNA gyrase B-, and HSP90-like ATPase [Ruminococcaceae bacterium YRB3002]|nr:Histidine kinase-, DNA gyrase B-, and HSP90-like ATPase [Ruminococcaceae bacterium YRB3002]
MSRNKRNSKNNMSKPVLSKIIARYLVVFLLAGLAASSLFLVFHMEQYRSGKTAEYEYYLERVNNELDNSVRYSASWAKAPEFKVNVQYVLCSLYDRYGVSSKYYIDSNEAGNSVDSVFMEVPLLNKKQTRYIIDDISCLNGFEEYSGGRYFGPSAARDNIRVGVRRYCVDTWKYRFIPVQFEVMQIDPHTGYATMIDYYRGEVEEQVGFGYRNEDKATADLPYLERIGDPGISSEYTPDSFKSQGLTSIINIITDADNNTHQTNLLVSQYQVPPYLGTYWYLVLIIYLGTVIAASLLSVIAGYVRFTKDKAVYDMIEYRRKTTNAMAHDLKTPLAAISAYAENLQQSITEDKRAYYSSRIIDNVGVMNRMIEEILQFSRSEVRNSTISQEDVDVSKLLAELKEEVKPLYDDNGVILRISCNSNVVLRTDRSLLKQSLLNLLTNAAKYSVKSTETEAVLSRSKITITNTSAVEIDDVTRLKEPFVKGHDSRGEKDGTGLGLSIADNNLSMLGYSLDISYENGKFTARINF